MVFVFSETETSNNYVSLSGYSKVLALMTQIHAFIF